MNRTVTIVIAILILAAGIGWWIVLFGGNDDKCDQSECEKSAVAAFCAELELDCSSSSFTENVEQVREALQDDRFQRDAAAATACQVGKDQMGAAAVAAAAACVATCDSEKAQITTDTGAACDSEKAQITADAAAAAVVCQTEKDQVTADADAAAAVCQTALENCGVSWRGECPDAEPPAGLEIELVPYDDGASGNVIVSGDTVTFNGPGLVRVRYRKLSDGSNVEYSRGLGTYDTNVSITLKQETAFTAADCNMAIGFAAPQSDGGTADSEISGKPNLAENTDNDLTWTNTTECVTVALKVEDMEAVAEDGTILKSIDPSTTHFFGDYGPRYQEFVIKVSNIWGSITPTFTVARFTASGQDPLTVWT